MRAADEAAEMQGDRQASATNEPAKDNTVLSTTRYGMNNTAIKLGSCTCLDIVTKIISKHGSIIII